MTFQEVISKEAIPVLERTNEPLGQRTGYIFDMEGNLMDIGTFNQ